MVKRALLGLLVGIVFLSSSGLLGFFEVVVNQNSGKKPVFAEVASAQEALTSSDCAKLVGQIVDFEKRFNEDDGIASVIRQTSNNQFVPAYSRLNNLHQEYMDLLGKWESCQESTNRLDPDTTANINGSLNFLGRSISAREKHLVDSLKANPENNQAKDILDSHLGDESSYLDRTKVTNFSESGGDILKARVLGVDDLRCNEYNSWNVFDAIKSMARALCILAAGFYDTLVNAVNNLFTKIEDTIAVAASGSAVRDEIRNPSGMVKQLWDFAMSIANYILIATLIAMAFGATLRIDAYSVKKILPNLLVAFVLANMSLFLMGIAVDIADLLTQEANRAVNVPGGIMGAFKELASKIDGIIKIFGVALGIFNALGALFLILFLFLAAFAVYVFFTVRSWALMLYVAFSPLAFMSLALPATRNIFNGWSSGFVSWLMLTPITTAYLAMGAILLNMSGNLPDNNIVPFFAGIFFLGSCLFVPFKVKGVGASWVAQAGSMMRGFGKSAVTGVGEKTVSKMTKSTAPGALGTLTRGLGRGIATVAGTPSALRTRRAEVSKEYAGIVGRQAAWLTGDKNLERREHEKGVSAYLAENSATPMSQWDLSDKTAMDAALSELMKNPHRAGEFQGALAMQSVGNKKLLKSIGLDPNADAGQIQQKFFDDGAALSKGIAHTTGSVDRQGNIQFSDSTLERVKALQKGNIEAGFADKATYFKGNTPIEKYIPDEANPGQVMINPEFSASLLNALNNQPASIAKHINALGGNIVDQKTGKIMPHIAQLAAGGQLHSGVLSQLGPDNLRNFSKSIPDLAKELEKPMDIIRTDKAGNFTKSRLEKSVNSGFNVADAIKKSDTATERGLKMAYVGGTQGIDAMNLMNKDSAERALNAFNEKLDSLRSSQFSAGQQSSSAPAPVQEGGLRQSFEDNVRRQNPPENNNSQKVDVDAGGSYNPDNF